MQAIILYGSYYGTTALYATKLSKQTGVPAVAYHQIKDFSKYDTVFYFGSLYAGNVLGLSKTVKKLSIDYIKKLIVITVGLADPSIPSNKQHIRDAVAKQVPNSVYKKITFYHLRGAMDYQKLCLKHRWMMRFLYHQLKNLPPNKQTAETKAMSDTRYQAVNFIDYDQLVTIADELK